MKFCGRTFWLWAPLCAILAWPVAANAYQADWDEGGGCRTSGQGGYLLPKGLFHTRGSQIVDRADKTVRIASVGWPGDDGLGFAPRGLYTVNYKATMRGMVADGFNTIRIPWNDLLLTQNAVPAATTIDYTVNPDLKGLTGIQVIDKIVQYAGRIGLRIIFDHHTNDGGAHGYGGQQGNGLWFDKGPGTDNTDGNNNAGTITAEQFKKDTLALVRRYKDDQTVIGYDLDNEPLSYPGTLLTWGQGGPDDLWQMYTDVGNAILDVNPHLLIICEGPQTTTPFGNGLAGNSPEGDLSAVDGEGGVPAKPVILDRLDQVVYSVHEYGPEVYDFGDNEKPSTYIPHLNRGLGLFIHTEHRARLDWRNGLGPSQRDRANLGADSAQLHERQIRIAGRPGLSRWRATDWRQLVALGLFSRRVARWNFGQRLGYAPAGSAGHYRPDAVLSEALP